MSKLKTHKATLKRVKISKNKKLITKTCGQDHFNAKETGNKTRSKRRRNLVNKSDLQNYKDQLPYHA